MPASKSPRLASHHALRRQRPRLQVDALGGAGLLAGTAAELERGGMAAGELEEVRSGDAVAGRGGGVAAGGEGVGGGGQRLDRPGPVALNRVDPAESPLRGGERRPVVLTQGGDLAPAAHRVGELAGQLGPGPVAFEGDNPLLHLLARRPELERVVSHAGGVAVGVHRLELGGGAQQLAPRPLLVVGAEPVRRHLDAGRAARLEALAELAMQLAAAQPGDVAVQRLAHESVAKRGLAVAALMDEADLEQLPHPGLASQLGHRLELEARAGDSRHLGGGPALGAEVAIAQQHRVAHRLGDGDLAAFGQLEPGRAGLQPALAGEGTGQLLHEERQPLGAVVDGAHQRPRGSVAEQVGEQRRGAGFVERLERDLVEDAAAAQVAAQAPQRVLARQLVGAVGGDEQ